LTAKSKVDRMAYCLTLPLVTHVNGHRCDKLPFVRFLAHEPDRVDSCVHTRRDAKEPDERFPLLKRPPQGYVVVLIGLGLAPLVTKVSVCTFGVLVRLVLRSRPEGRQDSKCSIEPLHRIDAFRTVNQRDLPSFELEGVEIAKKDRASRPLHEPVDICQCRGPQAVVIGAFIHVAEYRPKRPDAALRDPALILVGGTGIMPPGMVSKFTKSESNKRTEKEGLRLLLADGRFQRVDVPTKRRILDLIGKSDRFGIQTFDAVMTPERVEPIDVGNVDVLFPSLTLIEMKTTRGLRRNIRDEHLEGFFFGATEREYDMARTLGERYLFAFVVLSTANDYGRPFAVLLTLDEVERRTRSRRIQYQVNFKTDFEEAGGVGPGWLVVLGDKSHLPIVEA